MSEPKTEHPPEMRVQRVRATMNDHASSNLFVRDLPVYMSDEKPGGGGQNRGPSPLEYVVMGLCG